MLHRSIARIRDVCTTGCLLPHGRLWSLSDSHHATAVTAPSRPTTAEAVAGFDPRAALAGYRSPSRGLVLLPPWGFSRRACRAFAEMTGSPQRGYVENAQRACRERRNRSSRRARRSLAPEAAPRAGATSLVAHTSWLARAHDSAGQTGLRRATRSARGRQCRTVGASPSTRLRRRTADGDIDGASSAGAIRLARRERAPDAPRILRPVWRCLQFVQRWKLCPNCARKRAQ